MSGPPELAPPLLSRRGNGGAREGNAVMPREVIRPLCARVCVRKERKTNMTRICIRIQHQHVCVLMISALFFFLYLHFSYNFPPGC